MHQPGCRWLTGTRYYRFVRDFHAVHHSSARTNFGFALPPLFDWAFGTCARRAGIDVVTAAGKHERAGEAVTSPRDPGFASNGGH
jgi:sterol desaturase/sphingolipid hydroxylase (fatty acid hydroxylase superfamily)